MVFRNNNPTDTRFWLKCYFTIVELSYINELKLPDGPAIIDFGAHNEIISSYVKDVEIRTFNDDTYSKVMSTKLPHQLAFNCFKYVTEEGYIVLRNMTFGNTGTYIFTLSMDLVIHHAPTRGELLSAAHGKLIYITDISSIDVYHLFHHSFIFSLEPPLGLTWELVDVMLHPDKGFVVAAERPTYLNYYSLQGLAHPNLHYLLLL